MLNVWKKLDNLAVGAVMATMLAIVTVATLVGGVVGLRAEHTERARWVATEGVVTDAHVAPKGRYGNQVLADLVVDENSVNAVVGAQTQNGDTAAVYRNRETGVLYRPMSAGATPTTDMVSKHLLEGVIGGIVLALALFGFMVFAENRVDRAARNEHRRRYASV